MHADAARNVERIVGDSGGTVRVADEGFLGALRFAKNLALHRDARRRVLAMRRTFRKHRRQLAGVAIVAHKPGGGANPAVSKGKGCC